MDMLPQKHNTVTLCIEPGKEKHKYVYNKVKRFFDITISAIALLILAIPMLVIMLLIRIDSPGPAIFKQKRVGYKGECFTIYKFRSLRTDAPSDVATNNFKNIDEYTTGVGEVLRKYSIDELPQLLNILVGNMSLVGFRPVCISERRLNMLRLEHGVFNTKPGLTGLAQINGRDSLSIQEKVMWDAEYIQKRSFLFDFKCLLKTVPNVIDHFDVR